MLRSRASGFWVQGIAKALRQGPEVGTNLTLGEAERGPVWLEDSGMRCP